MVRSDLVANQKPTAVRVYDYYEPGQGRDVDTNLHVTVIQSIKHQLTSASNQD